VLVELADPRDILRDQRDEHLAPILLVALAPDESGLLEPVDHARNGARGQTGHLREPPGGRATFEIEEIQAFEIGTRNAHVIRHRLTENRTHARGTPHRVFEFLHQRGARFSS
jgi:hypothetical protein